MGNGWTGTSSKVKRMMFFLIVSFGILMFVIASVIYSWTYTPFGRLDYKAAMISKLSEWNKSPIEISKAARERLRNSRFSAGPSFGAIEGVISRDIKIPRPDGSVLEARSYSAFPERKLPIYLDIHGGAWFVGDGYPLDNVYKHLAKNAEVLVVAIEYRLLPEHPYPAAFDDSVLSLSWLAKHADSIGGISKKIAVGGGSAGGNLAAALALHSRDFRGPDIAFQFLFVPATDLSDLGKWDSFAQMGDKYMLKASDIKVIIDKYVTRSEDRLSPYASPLLADSLEGLPPAFIVTAQYDPLRDQGEAYAEALISAGVQVDLLREEGTIHGFAGSTKKMEKIYKSLSVKLKKVFREP